MGGRKILLALMALVCVGGRAENLHLTIAHNGVEVLPSHGSAAGVWFYEHDDSQLLLLGFAGQRLQKVRFTSEQGWTINGVKVSEWVTSEAVAHPVEVTRAPYSPAPVQGSRAIAPVIAQALIEWDWACRDGLETPRAARPLPDILTTLRARVAKKGLAPVPQTNDRFEWQALHHALRTDLLKRLPKAPLLFAKFVPSAMSHQLTQCLGYCARPGGGLFILEEPGRTMAVKDITPPALLPGSFMNPDLSFDATRVLFSHASMASDPSGTYMGGKGDPRFCDGVRRGIRYSVYEVPIEGGAAKRLTSGDQDDLFPIYLADGDILFSSTRRGGYHRCGMGPCDVFTLTRMGPHGENPHLVSFHETHEWTPALLDDGRVLYSRWDYCDRNGVLYQQLWTSRPDGGGTAIYYGNNTWNPCGTWEARPVPGSRKVMAIAGPHHAMAAGSVILVDTEKGIDGLGPLTRLTPEVRFAESEEPVMHGPPHPRDIAFDWRTAAMWSGSLMDPGRQAQPTEEETRWPGESFKSPWPLAEDLFLASFTFDRLFGEPGGNPPNQYGIYLCDADGGRELLYRDPRISSLWARPILPRKAPPAVRSAFDADAAARGTGTFYLANVYDSWPKALPAGEVKALRIFHIINKTTPNIDNPKVAAGLGAFGREVLGTVPVESDGSAYFEAPASMPLYFQALDAKGRAIQTMRSAVYLNPGVRESCTGCHEDRRTSAPPSPQTAARGRVPSKIAPGPVGSRPFNFLKLVQPILDAKCVKCHDGTKEKCPSLKGEPEGWACKSFNVLVRHVEWSGWGREPHHNHEPMTLPGTFGAVASPLLKRLESKHGGVEFTPDEWERLNTWMDANGACWGTFDAAQQRDL